MQNNNETADATNSADELVEVSWSIDELIGLPNYSNVRLGPVTIKMKVAKDRIDEGFEECAKRVERSLAIERSGVLDALKTQDV